MFYLYIVFITFIYYIYIYDTYICKHFSFISNSCLFIYLFMLSIHYEIFFKYKRIFHYHNIHNIFFLIVNIKRKKSYFTFLIHQAQESLNNQWNYYLFFLYAYIHTKVFENYIKTRLFIIHSKLNFKIKFWISLKIFFNILFFFNIYK